MTALPNVQWTVALSKLSVFPVARELDLATTRDRGGGVGKSQENQSILGKDVITPFVSPSCMDEHRSDPVQSCNQLPRTTSDRVDYAITHIILSAQNVHGLKSQRLYAIRPILNIQIACAPWCSDGKELAFNAGNLRLISGSGKSWRREWQPTPVLLPGESHG